MGKIAKSGCSKFWAWNEFGPVIEFHAIYRLNTVLSHKTGSYENFLSVIIFFRFLFHADFLKLRIFLWLLFLCRLSTILPFHHWLFINFLLLGRYQSLSKTHAIHGMWFWWREDELAYRWRICVPGAAQERVRCDHIRHQWSSRYDTCVVYVQQDVSINSEFKVKLIAKSLGYQLRINLLRVTLHSVCWYELLG